MMNEYAIDEGFYNIFEGIELNEEKVRTFLINLHKLLQESNKLSESKIREQKDILKAELKNELTKELATKADFNEIKKDIEFIHHKFEEVDRRFEQIDRRFEQIDKRFEQIDRRFEQVDKKFDSMILRIDRFMFLSLGLTISSTLLIIGFLFKFFGN